MATQKRDINSIIHDQLLGYISEEDMKRLQAWLESSPDHRREYERLTRDTALLRRYRQFASIDEKQAWRRFQQKHFHVRKSRWRTLCRYAAIFMLPIAGIIAWLCLPDGNEPQPVGLQEDKVAMIRSEKMGKQKAILILTNGEEIELKSAPAKSLQDSTIYPVLPPQKNQETSPEKAEETADNNKLVTYDNSEFWLTLEDGTKVHLNYNTTLKYPPHFSASGRTVYLEGEAYFKIAKDNERPFRVITADGIVKQYGTSFNVNTHVTGVTKVVLVEGSVSVFPHQGGEYKIQPGELAVLHAASPDVRITKVDIEPYIAWNNGRFVFDNCSLESLMNVISRWYDKNIFFESEEIKKIRFTGDIDRYGSIIPILKAIQRVTHLKMETEGENIIIKR